MSIAPHTLLGIAIVPLLLLQYHSEQFGGAISRISRTLLSAAILAIILFCALHWDNNGFAEIGTYISNRWVSPSTLTIAIGVIVAALTTWRARKLPVSESAKSAWGITEIALCFLFALNMFFIALPEIRFFFGLITQRTQGSPITWPSFLLFYSDTQRVEMNPIFDLLRYGLVWYTPVYFLTPMACAYLMALAIAFFCAVASPFIGYYSSIALAAGLCWTKPILLSVFMITNLVTLFLAISLSMWLLYQARLATASNTTRLRVVVTGLLMGLGVTFTLYAYVASRSICGPILGLASIALAWRTLRPSRLRAYYIVALLTIALVPGALLISEYAGRWDSFMFEFRAGVPNLAKIQHGRPAYIDPSLEASHPDLPAYYGAIIADIPQADGSFKRDWTYWYRSSSELVWVVWNNFGRILRHQLPFPGGRAAWFFALIGLIGSIAMFPSRRKAIVYSFVLGFTALLLISPFIIIPAPGEWRRGVAVALIFGSLSGLGVYLCIRLFFPKVNEKAVAVVASTIIFTILGRSAITSIASTSIDEVHIAMLCRFNPLGPLYLGLKKYPQIVGNIIIVGSPEDRCIHSVSKQLNAMIGGDRVRLFDPKSYNLADLKSGIASGDGLVLHCGALTGGEALKLCNQLRGSSDASLLYSAPIDREEIWMISNDA
jgi:hypothetical protein